MNLIFNIVVIKVIPCIGVHQILLALLIAKIVSLSNRGRNFFLGALSESSSKILCYPTPLEGEPDI